MGLRQFVDKWRPHALRPFVLDQDQRYQEALAFKDRAEGIEGKDYDWVCNYAETVYGQLMATRDALDDKANDVIKYLGGGAGLFTLAALMTVKPENIGVFCWALPSFLCALISVFFAVRAREPSDVAYPPTIKTAVEYIEHFADGQTALGAFLGQWHAACEGMHIVVGHKAELVTLSIKAYFWTIFLLLLPVAKTVWF